MFGLCGRNRVSLGVVQCSIWVTLFLLHSYFIHYISIVSRKAVAGSGFDVTLGGVAGTSLSSISYSILLISWCMVAPAELSVIYGSAYLVVLFL